MKKTLCGVNFVDLYHNDGHCLIKTL